MMCIRSLLQHKHRYILPWDSTNEIYAMLCKDKSCELIKVAYQHPNRGYGQGNCIIVLKNCLDISKRL